MIRDFSDPVGAFEVHKARTDEACRAFKAGEISESVFAAQLYGLGFTNRQIAAEIRENFSPQRTTQTWVR